MFTKQINFKKYSSIKIGNECLVKVLEFNDDLSIDAHIIGKANNLLVAPDTNNLAILSDDFNYLKIKNNMFLVGASSTSGKMLKFVKEHNIFGFEFLSKLPGTLGGMLSMNAGVKEYEIFNNLIYLKTSTGIYEKKDILHGYRFAQIDGIIIEAGFELKSGFSEELLLNLIRVRSNQPKSPSFGSIFKNPKDDYAGRLIEKCGLKGESKGGAMISDVHANFLVNKKKDATYLDAIYLIELIEKEVYSKFKIKLEREVIICSS